MEAFNSQVLDALLSARHLSFEAISRRIGRSDQDVRNEIDRVAGPSQGLINDLSAELSVPSFVFFMDEAPHLEDTIVDFRLENPSYQPKSRATTESIEMARDLQSIAERLQHADTLERGVDLKTVRLPDYAADLRERLGISLEAQIECKDPGTFYALCRSAIERQGVFVLHESFPAEDGSGFCLALSSARLITVNTLRQNRSRRNFTLAHELAHALISRTGISDPFITKNHIERSCNLFAAQFLIPKSLAEQAYARFKIGRSPTVQNIARTASYLNVSQQATVVRFEQIGLVDEGSHDKWLLEPVWKRVPVSQRRF